VRVDDAGGNELAAPTAAIFPSRNRIDAFGSVGPAAVMTVAPRMNVVRDVNGLYVLGNAFALGSERAPAPG
jgi:hypothetical protein